MILKAGEAGFVRAQYNLGKMYRDGIGTETDPDKSISWFQRAAEQGYAKAQNRLSLRYSRGEGVAKDEAYGNALILHDAESGDIGAQFYLMRAYEYGYHGLPADKDEAAYWKRKYEAETGED